MVWLKITVNYHGMEIRNLPKESYRNIYKAFLITAETSPHTELSVHCLLSSIEKMRNDPSQGGAIPDTLYLQIDGGAENTAKSMLGMCELLVARRIVKKIVLTRLPTGHSHEDIDAVFANIWTYIRSQSILSPQQYKLFILQALKKRDISVHVEDVFAIPDYTAYLEPFVDPELSR